jgi:hypothetical protein
MKPKFLSILSSDTAENSAADEQASSQQVAANYRARYQAFLSQQAQQRPQRGSYEPNGLVRLVQAVLSFSIFVVMFLTILTLFGFGLSKLGVIAQVSDGSASVSGKNSSPAKTDTPIPTAPIKKSRRK